MLISVGCAVYNILFVYDEELKGGIHGYSLWSYLYFCQPTEVATGAVRMQMCARISYVRTLLGAIVGIEVGLR